MTLGRGWEERAKRSGHWSLLCAGDLQLASGKEEDCSHEKTTGAVPSRWLKDPEAGPNKYHGVDHLLHKTAHQLCYQVKTHMHTILVLILKSTEDTQSCMNPKHTTTFFQMAPSFLLDFHSLIHKEHLLVSLKELTCCSRKNTLSWLNSWRGGDGFFLFHHQQLVFSYILELPWSLQLP